LANRAGQAGGQSPRTLDGRRRRGAEAPSLLSGLIVDADGDRMTPTHASKGAKRYRYYVSSSLLAGDRRQACKGMRIPAGDVEGLVIDADS